MILDVFGDERSLTGEITAGIILRQQFVAKGNVLDGISFCFATYQRYNSCTVRIDIIDSTGAVICKKGEHGLKFRDNAYHDFKLGHIKLQPGRRYEMRISSSNGRGGCSVTAKWGAKRHPESSFYVGKREVNGELAFILHYFEQKVEEKKRIERFDRRGLCGIDGLVSVVIPCYNSAKLLPACLESLAKQTYNCIEVVVVDDGSDDFSELEQVVKNAKKKYRFPIMLVQSSRNLGANSARNKGFFHTSGDFLLFLDSDCVLVPDALETYLSTLRSNPKSSYSYCNYKLGESVQRFHDFDASTLLQRNYISTMSMIRRSHFPGFDESLRRLQDWDLWLTMLRFGLEGAWVGNKSLFVTEYRHGGITKGGSIPLSLAYDIVRSKHNFWNNHNDKQCPNVTGVMVVYKTLELFKKAYVTIRTHYPTLKLIIVDGSGKDDKCTNHIVGVAKSDPHLMHVMYPYNIGHGRGMHIGIMKSQTDFVYLIDSDTWTFKGNIIEKMLGKMKGNTHSIGSLLEVDRAGMDVKKGGIPYVHPSVCLLSRWNYLRFRPFKPHGAPCIGAMSDIHDKGLSKKVLIDFPVKEYVKHEWRGTRGKFGMTVGR